LILLEKKMRLLLQEKDEPVQLNHWISAELEQDDKIFAAAPAKHWWTANLPYLGANGPGIYRCRAWAPMPEQRTVTHNTRSSRSSCVARAEKDGQCSDEDKDLPFGTAHTQTNTDITGGSGEERVSLL
jgi:hypothetical protein